MSSTAVQAILLWGHYKRWTRGPEDPRTRGPVEASAHSSLTDTIHRLRLRTRSKPWPTRPPTSDNNSPITKRIRTNETPKCFSNLGDCSGLSKEARSWNHHQGSSQLTVWQWLTRARTSRTTNSKTDKKRRHQDTSNYSNFRRRQERYRPKQTQPTFSGPFFYGDVGVA